MTDHQAITNLLAKEYTTTFAMNLLHIFKNELKEHYHHLSIEPHNTNILRINTHPHYIWIVFHPNTIQVEILLPHHQTEGYILEYEDPEMYNKLTKIIDQHNQSS